MSNNQTPLQQAAAELDHFAELLVQSHTINGVWAENEGVAKTEYEYLKNLAAILRETHNKLVAAAQKLAISAEPFDSACADIREAAGIELTN